LQVAAGHAPPLVLGTAGHIDHGKTVLVRALTGVDTDRLPEERARGISIELGFAPLELPSGRTLGVVDVPGHERFVRTMVAGATGIDLFLLAVAADDGVMPQTREHFGVLRTLGVPLGVVALTKTDLVGAEELALAKADIVELLAGGPYEGIAIVPVSAPKATGLAELLAALDDAASQLPGRAARDGEPRLHVDRAFSLKGIGTVVTGTLWAGTIGAGDEVSILPGGVTARVRAVEVHGGRVERAGAGQRVALNLAGIDRRAVARGDVVTAREPGARPTYLVDAAVELLPGARPLGRGARVHLHHGTRDVPARVAPLEGDELAPGGRAYAQLRLEQPVVPAPDDRFVLRQLAPPDTIGGGTVLDAAPRKHGPGPEHVERLRLVEQGGELERLEARLAGARSGLGADEAEGDLIERLAAAGKARRMGSRRPRYFTPALADEARERLLRALAERGRGRPLSRGAIAAAAGLSDQAAAAVLDELVGDGRVIARGTGFLPAGTSTDPGLERVLDALRADALEPRAPDVLAADLEIPSDRVRSLLEELALDERAIRIKPALYYHADALRAAEDAVVSICRREGSVTIAGLRDALGTSRKYSQALLEHFDARRLTRREGDEHVLRANRRAGPGAV
jgi:selenocysteine-specific elongation factor